LVHNGNEKATNLWIAVVCMDDDDDVYRAGVGEMFANFREALLAILPIANRAMISSDDETMHRDWELLAQGLFDAFVRGPIESDRGLTVDEFPLARYDIDYDDYANTSWLTTDALGPHRGVIVRFLSIGSPFDAVQVVDLDPAMLRKTTVRTIPVDELTPCFYRRDKTGRGVVIRDVESVE
jgi:hypothetical protein